MHLIIMQNTHTLDLNKDYSHFKHCYSALKCILLYFRVNKGKLRQQKKKLNQQEERDEEDMFKGM